MSAWEYRTVQVGVATHDPRPGAATEHPVNRRLQALGAEGWELASTALTSDPAFVLLFFRREIQGGKVASLRQGATPEKAAAAVVGAA